MRGEHEYKCGYEYVDDGMVGHQYQDSVCVSSQPYVVLGHEQLQVNSQPLISPPSSSVNET